mgnify:CR=1 FL=1
MRVVIEVGSGRNDPVDKAGFDKRDQRRNAEARGRQRTGERDADRDIVLQHLLIKQLARLTQTGPVIGHEGLVD